MTQRDSAARVLDSRNPDHRVAVEPSPKWVRVVFAGQVIADSRRPLLLFETGHTPVYYFPREDVRMDLLHPTDHTTHCPYKGDAGYWTVRAGDREAENAVWGYPQPLPDAPDIGGYVAFYWHMMDAWFEEGEQVYVHPRDPYKRIDVIQSTRRVRVVVGGETVADTTRPVLLFETGLPVRYYIPKLDVRMDLLVPSDHITRCPYKGEANYYSVRTGETEARDIAWYYTYPTPEAAKIAGRLAFYNERVDALYVDGEAQEKPRTRWS